MYPCAKWFDVGVKRFLLLSKIIQQEAIYAGSEYYFAVTAYNYNPAPDLIEDKALESALLCWQLLYNHRHLEQDIPARWNNTDFESIGESDGQIEGVVVDPGKVTGDVTL